MALTFTCERNEDDKVSFEEKTSGDGGVWIESDVEDCISLILLSRVNAERLHAWLGACLGKKTSEEPHVVVGRGLGEIPSREDSALLARDTMRALANAFMWNQSPEGDAFWRSIYNRLKEMAQLHSEPAKPPTDFERGAKAMREKIVKQLTDDLRAESAFRASGVSLPEAA